MHTLSLPSTSIESAGIRTFPDAAASAATQRRLASALRDAHAGTGRRIAVLRHSARLWRRGGSQCSPFSLMVTRLLTQAEEQLRRLEHALAWIDDHPGATGLPDGVLPSEISAGNAADKRVLVEALGHAELRSADTVLAMRLLAHMSGQHLTARLLDMSRHEHTAAARGLRRLAEWADDLPPC